MAMKMLSRRFYLFFMALIFVLGSALMAHANKAKKQRSPSSTLPPAIPIKGSGPIEKSQWFSWMKESLSAELCDDQSYLRTCFQLKQKKCQAQMAQQLNTCWGRESIRWKSQVIHPRKEGVVIGYHLGLCAGMRMESQNKMQKKKSDDCRYMNQWMGRK
jgi:hypothetical protein